MTDSDWWARAKLPPRPQPIEIRKRETICTLRKGEHEIVLEKRPVFGVGEELILSVGAAWRRMRVFQPQGPMLSAAVAETVTKLEPSRPDPSAPRRPCVLGPDRRHRPLAATHALQAGLLEHARDPLAADTDTGSTQVAVNPRADPILRGFLHVVATWGAQAWPRKMAGRDLQPHVVISPAVEVPVPTPPMMAASSSMSCSAGSEEQPQPHGETTTNLPDGGNVRCGGTRRPNSPRLHPLPAGRVQRPPHSRAVDVLGQRPPIASCPLQPDFDVAEHLPELLQFLEGDMVTDLDEAGGRHPEAAANVERGDGRHQRHAILPFVLGHSSAPPGTKNPRRQGASTVLTRSITAPSCGRDEVKASRSRIRGSVVSAVRSFSALDESCPHTALIAAVPIAR